MVGMTRLERRITELAGATGQTVYVGAKGYKSPFEWFAGCQRGKGDLVEGYGSSAETALDALLVELQEEAERVDRKASAAAEMSRRLNALGTS
jgi:hypothetical protein